MFSVRGYGPAMRTSATFASRGYLCVGASTPSKCVTPHWQEISFVRPSLQLFVPFEHGPTFGWYMHGQMLDDDPLHVAGASKHPISELTDDDATQNWLSVHASHGSLVEPELDPPLLLVVLLLPHASIAVHDEAPTMHERTSAEKLPQFASQLGGVASHFVVIAEQTSVHDVVAPPDEEVPLLLLPPLLPLEFDVPVVSEVHAARAVKIEAAAMAITTLRASMRRL
jgi:hypothetical protein